MAIRGTNRLRRAEPRTDAANGLLQIRLFGSIELASGARRLGPRDFGGVKPRQILEILLLKRGRPVSKDVLADCLWGEKVPMHVSGALETYVSVLRRRLVPGGSDRHRFIVTEHEAYRFAVDHADIDLDRFDRLLARAGHAGAREAQRLLEQALEIAKGDLLEDEPYAEWAIPLRDYYRELTLQARLKTAAAALVMRDHEAALQHASRALSVDPYREDACRAAMLALHALGRTHDALAAYERCRRLLDEDLDAAPTSETIALEEAIRRRDDPESLLPAPSRERVIVPDDTFPALPFLGRSRELATIDTAVKHALAGSFSFVLVEGGAGIGKSRLLAEAMSLLPSGVRLGYARCSQLERVLSYVPLAETLRGALAGVEIEPGRYPGLGRIMAELDDPPRPGPGRPVSELESLVRLVREQGRLVLVLDDLHWADVRTVVALSYLQRRCSTAPVAILASLRPEDLGRRQAVRWLEPTARIRLEPLARDELEPLGVPGLYERSGGHPLFVSAAIGNGGAPDVPQALRDFVLVRAGSAGTNAMQILAAAAAFDGPFSPGALAAILKVDLGEVMESLERLCELQLLLASGERFGFRFGLIGEIVRAIVSPSLLAELIRRRSLAS